MTEDTSWKLPGKRWQISTHKIGLARRIARWKDCLLFNEYTLKGTTVTIDVQVPQRKYEKACGLLGLKPATAFLRQQARGRELGRKFSDGNKRFLASKATKKEKMRKAS